LLAAAGFVAGAFNAAACTGLIFDITVLLK